jgi:hypothetical protein
MIMVPPEKPDTKAHPIVESGKGLPEGQPREELLKYYKVLCPKCRNLPGFPCTFGQVDTPAGKKLVVDVWSIHIARVLAYEAYALGTVDMFGQPIKKGLGE